MNALELLKRLGWRCLTLAWLWFLATSVGVAFRGAVNPPVSAFMEEKQLEIEARHLHAKLDYQWTDYEDIAPYMRLAVITAEDQNFPYHHGFDWDAIAAALVHNATSRRMHGGSTISQQTAKNLWLWPGRSYVRKAVEAWFTALMEAEWPKWRILEVYLNVAQFDDYTFGVGAASRRLFDVTPSELKPEEAALLATTLPAPDRYDVTDPSARMQRQEAWILDQMEGLGGPEYLDVIDPPLPPKRH
ncbi:MAG TPA: monofunctional biosynthetic peptidoglycan transglycosylase [Gammaproteobacteria bacterium]|nr:monofunctional biosynthetic peptidoglycan transglycosylase [Gammaproteobacteria bacterium]